MISAYIRNNILGVVAIFLALCGVGHSFEKKAPKLRRNSVTSKVIKDGQVLSRDIGDGAVSRADLAGDSVDGSAVKDDSLTGADVNEASLDIPTDPTKIQTRVSGGCAAGESIRAINENGSVTCQGAGGPPSGAAGGDLTGTYPNPGLAANSVGSSEVAADSLTASDLAADSVGSSEVAANSLTAGDLAADSVGSSEVAADAIGSSEITTNAVGTTEIATDSVGRLDIGPAAVGSTEIADLFVQRNGITLDPGESAQLSILCPGGSTAIGGGGGGGISGNRARLLISEPTDGTASALVTGDAFSGWRIGWENTDAFSSASVHGYAICID